MIEAIFAVDINNGLAKSGYIPWNIKKDIEFFREKTINNIVVMGSKTFLSLPNSQPLKNRFNIVVTNNPHKYSNMYFARTSKVVFVTLPQCIDFLQKYSNEKIFVIGGNETFKMLSKYCEAIWLTTVKKSYECDLQLDINVDNYSKECVYEDEDIIINRLTQL